MAINIGLYNVITPIYGVITVPENWYFGPYPWVISHDSPCRRATGEAEEAPGRLEHSRRGFHREKLRRRTGGVQVALHGATTQTLQI